MCLRTAELSADVTLGNYKRQSLRQQGHTCRSSRCSTKNQPLSLSQSNVASVCQRCDTQAATVANVFIRVLDLSIADVNLGFLALLVLVVPQLTLPLEARLVFYALFYQTLHHISSVHVNGTECNELLAVVLGQLPIDDGDEVC